MTRIEPVSADQVTNPNLLEAMAIQREQLGVVPQSLMTMAHRPEMAAAWARLTATVVGPGDVSGELKQLVAYIASLSHGCMYCQAHTGHKAAHLGVEPEKLQSVLEAESRPDLFSEAERAAMALAWAAARSPSEATDDHFTRLSESFSDAQIVEIAGVIAMFGWLNRWNDMMATTLEDGPLEFANEVLAQATGWTVGAHAAVSPE